MQLQQQQIKGHVFGDARIEKREPYYIKRSVKETVPVFSRLAETGLREILGTDLTPTSGQH